MAKHVMGDEGQNMLNRFAQPKRLDGVMQAVWRIVAALLAVLLVVGALAHARRGHWR